jgi:hypothetical protein
MLLRGKKMLLLLLLKLLMLEIYEVLLLELKINFDLNSLYGASVV